MLKISDAVATTLLQDMEALHVFKADCLNLSAYAKKIQPTIMQMVKKDVQVGSIVIALTRLRTLVQQQPNLHPLPTAMNMSVRSGLMELVYERTDHNVQYFNQAQQQLQTSTEDFLIATQGIAEITLIIDQKKLTELQSIFTNITPRFTLPNLSALTLRTTSKDIYTPNVFFTILRPFALEQINIIEIISTYTEITLMFEQKDVQRGFKVLEQFL